MANLVHTLKVLLGRWIKLSRPLVKREFLGRTLYVHESTLGAHPDYDDAWLAVLALHARIIFDVGANIGQSALLMLLLENVERVYLVEANPEALSMAAEVLIKNGLSKRACFIPAFAGEVDGAREQLWTIDAGAAGSKYRSHAVSAAKAGRSIEVSTVTVDALCDFYKVVPDFIKVDVEGAEHEVLLGSRRCAGQGRTRFLVEMHSPHPELPMEINAARVLDWCQRVDYRAWYLKEHVQLESPQQIEHRGRCHVLLQPAAWALPEWLAGVNQSDDVRAVLTDLKEREQVL